MYICLCQAVTDEEIRQAIQSGATSLPALQYKLGVSSQCGKCKPEVVELLKQSLKHQTELPLPPAEQKEAY